MQVLGTGRLRGRAREHDPVALDCASAACVNRRIDLDVKMARVVKRHVSGRVAVTRPPRTTRARGSA
jgi:hypothetical protein